MSVVGLYQPGRSLLHLSGAGSKLLGLLAFAVLLFVLRSPAPLGIAALVAVLGYPVARIPARRCGQAVRLTGPLLAVIFLVQWWLLGAEQAAVVCLRLLAALAAANLFTLTTKVDDLVSAVERGLAPTQRIGIRPDKIGLLVGLTLQAVAVLSSIARDTREAQLARNAGRSIPAFAVPFLVRTLRHSDELGEAMAARGIGDD